MVADFVQVQISGRPPGREKPQSNRPSGSMRTILTAPAPEADPPDSDPPDEPEKEAAEGEELEARAATKGGPTS